MSSTHRTPRATDRTSRSAEATVYARGGGPLGAAVARRLRTDGREAVLVDASADGADDAVPSGDPTDSLARAEAGLGSGSVVVLATPSDNRNRLAAQLVRSRFDVERVVVPTNRPHRVETMAGVSHDRVRATDDLAEVLVDRL